MRFLPTVDDYIIIPDLLPYEEQQREFTSNNGLILDPLKEYNDNRLKNMWTDPEKAIFKEKFLEHPKNFRMIAQNLERKSTSDCVQYYYQEYLGSDSISHNILLQMLQCKISSLYRVRLEGLYIVQRFSANFSENCSEADSGRLWGSRGKFKTVQAF